jgi:patatin-like phospholipase/acyl hydrolase
MFKKFFMIMYAFFAINTEALKLSNCNVLALSGGGSFGAVEMGVLDSVTNDGRAPVNFDIITGISAGGLNTGFLSYYNNVRDALKDIKNIYANLTTPQIYERDIIGIFSEWSIYNTKPLENTLTNILRNKTPISNGPISLIGSTNTNTTQLDVFVFHPNFTVSEKVNILMATSAIPFVFPPRFINTNIYVDGGVISNELITESIGVLPCNWYNITFISASPKNNNSVMVTGLFTYVDLIVQTLLNSFDSQFASISNCSYPRGNIRACYPTSPLLDNYSILDFNNGEILYNLGLSSNECKDIPLCV